MGKEAETGTAKAVAHAERLEKLGETADQGRKAV